MEQQSIVDPKIVDRINKLLRLARDGGATEGEANNALSMAQRIMLDNNLSMATVEMAGGEVGEAKRIKGSVAGAGTRSWAMYAWQRRLMEDIGTVNFCHVSVHEQWNGKKWRPSGYNIIGREGNVASAREMFTYLITTINRLLMDHNGGDHRQNMSKYSLSWKEGCADRLRERLLHRFNEALKEQRREAREKNAAARHPSASTGTALVVVMEDYAQKERDLNEDVRRGVPPGTTTAEREKEEAAQQERKAAWQETRAAAVAMGANDDELFIMKVHGCSISEARDLITKRAEAAATEAPKSEAQKQKEQKAQERWEQAYRRRREKEASRLDYRGYRAGQEAGESIGLDKQVEERATHKIGRG